MGVEAENHMAQKDAEERKPNEREIEIASSVLKLVRGSNDNEAMWRGIAIVLAEHRCETKRIVLEEQGIGNGQDLEKRAVLSARVVQLEAKVKELEVEKDRMAKALGYKMLAVRVELQEDVEQRTALYDQVDYLKEKLKRYENIRKQLNEDPTLMIKELP